MDSFANWKILAWEVNCLRKKFIWQIWVRGNSVTGFICLGMKSTLRETASRIKGPGRITWPRATAPFQQGELLQNQSSGVGLWNHQQILAWGLQAPLRPGVSLVFTVSRDIRKVTSGNLCAPLLAFFCDIISCGPIVLGSLPKVVLDIGINLPCSITESKFPVEVEADLSNLKGRPD